MALADDYKKLVNKWLTKTHSVGSPELDALIEMTDLAGTTRQEIAMKEGRYFTSSIQGVARAIDGIPDYLVVETAPDTYHTLEQLTVDVDYQNTGDGNVNITMSVYAMDSNRSDITIVGGTPQHLGVPLNLDYINTLSAATFTFDSALDKLASFISAIKADGTP